MAPVVKPIIMFVKQNKNKYGHEAAETASLVNEVVVFLSYN
jgi:hypothetical protein